MCLIVQNSSLKFDLLFFKVKVLVFKFNWICKEKKVNSYNNLIYFPFTGWISNIEFKSFFLLFLDFFYLNVSNK